MSISRRSVVTSAVPAVASIAADAELLELGREFDRAVEEENRLRGLVLAADVNGARGDMAGEPEHRTAEDFSDTVLHPLMDQIIAAPAETIEGLKVKAPRVVYWCKLGEIDEHDDGTTDMRSAFSIIKDLARLQGLEPISDSDYEGRYIKPLH
jgi:hypothetical protein